jgi:hypothetical protein
MPNQSARRAPSRATFLRSAETAAILHITPKTPNRWAQAGLLPFQRPTGGHRHNPKQAIRELAAGRAGEVAAS